MGLGREAHHVADRTDDPRGQYGTYAEDLGEGGAGGFHLGFDEPIQVSDLSIQRPDVAQHLRSQSPSEAGRGALGPYAAQDARSPRGRERPGHPAGNEVPQESVEAVERPGALGHQVLAPLGKESKHLRANLGSERCQPLVARSGQRGGQGIEPIVLLAGVACREHPNPCRELRRHVHTTDSPAAANLPARCRPRPLAFSTAQRRSGNRFAQRSRDLSPARFCGKLARSTSSPPASSTAATATDALWGSTPIKTFMSAGTSVSVEPLPLAGGGHSDFGPCSHTSFESLRTPRSPVGREPRTSQPISWATGSSGAIPITGDLEA